MLLVATVAGCGSSAGSDSGSAIDPAAVVESRSDTGSPFAGIEVDPGFPLPRARLTRDDGSPVQLARDLERPVRLFFYGYTLCPDVCTLIMADLALAVARLPADMADEVQVVFVTSDPARDTPEVLRGYLDRFDPDFTGLTGDLDTIVEVALTMGVAIEEGPRLPSGGYQVRHGAEVVGYTGDEGVVVWPQGTSVDDLSADLAALVAASRSGGGG